MYFHVFAHVDLHRGIVMIPKKMCEVKGLDQYSVLILCPIFFISLFFFLFLPVFFVLFVFSYWVPTTGNIEKLFQAWKMFIKDQNWCN